MKNIYPDILQWINDNHSFSFARYNDGEWGIILQKQPHYGVIEHRWGISFDDISTTLRGIVEKPLKYHVGIPPKLMRDWGPNIKTVINPNIVEVNSESLHEIPISEYRNFLNLLKSKNTLLVGPEYLRDLKFFTSHLPIPEKKVWDHIENIIPKINEFIRNNENPIIIYSASIATNIMIDRLYEKYGDTITQIDVGSTLDPHAGVLSRSGHKSYMEKNGLEIKRVFKKGR